MSYNDDIRHLNFLSYLLDLGVQLQEGFGCLDWDSQDERTTIVAGAGPDGNILVTGKACNKHNESRQEDSESRRRAGNLLQVRLRLLGQLNRLKGFNCPLGKLLLLVVGIVSGEGRHCEVLESLSPSLEALLQGD